MVVAVIAGLLGVQMTSELRQRRLEEAHGRALVSGRMLQHEAQLVGLTGTDGHAPGTRTARQALLAAAARHVKPDGDVYVEHYDVARMPVDRDGHVGPVRVSLRILDRHGTWFRGRVSYLLDGRRWEQTFEVELLDQPALYDELRQAGLRPADQLSDTWLVASPAYDR